MATISKRTRSKADKLADFLAGKAPLPHEFYSMGNLTDALFQLKDDEDVTEDEIAARAKSLIRSHHAVIEELTILRRALEGRQWGEPLRYALLRVRQAFARPARSRRRC